ncbi:MAG: hypothetical protein GY856_18845 [bacterium]|nr:hypothetical protein [bacterium]
MTRKVLCRAALPALAAGLVAMTCAYAQDQAAGATILITDVGQGNSAKIIRMLLRKNGVTDFDFKEIAAPEDLTGIELMIVGVGASTKGLGAAGLNLEAEKERAEALLGAATERKIKVIGVHIGGQPRRGELSDPLNEQVMLAATTFVVWKDGDADGFFTSLAENKLADAGTNETQLAELLRVVESKKDVGAVLKEMIDQPG